VKSLFAIAILLALAGCKSLQNEGAGEPDYAADADTNLTRGAEALESKNYLEASGTSNT